MNPGNETPSGVVATLRRSFLGLPEDISSRAASGCVNPGGDQKELESDLAGRWMSMDANCRVAGLGPFA